MDRARVAFQHVHDRRPRLVQVMSLSGCAAPPARCFWQHCLSARSQSPPAPARFACAGMRVWGVGCRVQGSGFRVQGSGLRVQGSGFRVQGSGFRVQGSGCRVQSSGFRHSGHPTRGCIPRRLGFVVYGSRAWGLGFDDSLFDGGEERKGGSQARKSLLGRRRKPHRDVCVRRDSELLWHIVNYS